MPRIRTRVSVAGFTESEVTEGIADLLEEFRERPWLLQATAEWCPHRSRLIVEIEREESDPESGGEATFDEVWDCVIAYISFSSDAIHFDIEDSRRIDE